MDPTEQHPLTPVSSPYMYPPPPPSRMTPSRIQISNRVWMMAGAIGCLIIFITAFTLVSRINEPHHALARMTMTPTQPALFGATVTPAIGATATNTVGPGTPTQTPIIVYIPAAPGKPIPTPRPATPYPTYTQPPSATATATPHPTLTLTDDMSGSSLEFKNSGDLNENGIGPDTTTINRGHYWQDWIEWNTPNIVGFQVTAYYCTDAGVNPPYPPDCGGKEQPNPSLTIAPLEIDESADGTTWCTPGMKQPSQYNDPNHPSWTQVTWTFVSSCVAMASYL